MSENSRKSSGNAVGIFLIILLLVLLLLGGLFFFFFIKVTPAATSTSSTSSSVTTKKIEESSDVDNDKDPISGASIGTGDVEKSSSPKDLATKVKESLEDGSIEGFLEKSGVDLDADQQQALKAFVTKNLKGDYQMRFVGAIEHNKKNRWAITGEDGAEIHLDLVQGDDGSWSIEEVTFRSEETTASALKGSDALGVADAFIRNVINQNFGEALKFVNEDSVTDVQLAGLCIMFEEGQYKLNEEKTLNTLFTRKGLAAFTVNLLNSMDATKGQIEIALTRETEQDGWRVSELNFQKLLKSYIDSVSGGDSYYTPLIKNPQGGDRLALFFDFNNDQLSPRAKKQLDIVASLIKSSKAKKLTISGHADAVGSEGYNKALSLERAKSVSAYLTSKGLKKEQVVISAYGESRPRSDNETDRGRRANRRTEIYLDF